MSLLGALERAKAAHTYLKEMGAPDEYSAAIVDLIEDLEATEKVLNAAEDELAETSQELADWKKDDENRRADLKSASDDLELVARAIQRLVG